MRPDSTSARREAFYVARKTRVSTPLVSAREISDAISDARPCPLRGRAAVGAPEAVGRVLRPPLGRVLPILLTSVDRHVEQHERPHDRLDTAPGRLVREKDAVLPTKEAGDVATAAD